MTRLPIIGSDDGTWGTILNEFLEVSHNSDGTLSSEALSSAGVILGTNVGQPGGVPSLSNTGVIPPAQLGSGSAGSTTYLRGDGSWQVPPGSGGSSTLSGDSDVSIVSPANNQVLTYDSSGSVWQNANLPVSVSTFNTRSGAVTLSKADVTATGLSYGDVGADAAGAAAAVSTTSIGALAKASNLSDVVSASSARTNLGLGTAATISSTAGGDLSGSLPSPMVVGLYGTPMNGNTPGGNDVMTYNSGSWGPAALPSAPVVSVAGKTGAVTLDEGDISNLTSDLSTIDGNITTLQGDVTTINSSLSSKYSGSNPPPYPVSTVFGRTGAVVATTGDYTVSEITGAAPLSSPTFTGTVSGITAAMVSNAADTSSASQQSFTGEVKVPDLAVAGLSGATAASRYVGATTSGAPGSGTFNKGDFVLDQTGTLWICTTAGSPGVWGQVSAGSATTAGSAGSATTAGSASPSGSAGGDLTGSYPSPTVSKINNVPVSGTPSSNNVLTYNSGSWGPAALPSAPVSTVFGRTGAIVATSGDYTVSEITGAAPLASPTFTGTVSGITAAMVSNAADKSSASQQTFTGDIQTPSLGVGTAPDGTSGDITASGVVNANGSKTFVGYNINGTNPATAIVTGVDDSGQFGAALIENNNLAGIGLVNRSGSSYGNVSGNSYTIPLIVGGDGSVKTTSTANVGIGTNVGYAARNVLDDGSGNMSSAGGLNMNSNKVTNLGNGSSSNDAAAFGQITAANAGAVALSTVTAAGDIIYATGSGAVGRLAIGSSGKVLTVSSGLPAWQAPVTLQQVYPVGSIYIETTGTNPATTFGFGTWAAFGAGQVLIGVGSYTDGNSTTETISNAQQLGEYEHQLTTTEMPYHNHSVTVNGNTTGIYDSGHSHGVNANFSSSSGGGSAYITATNDGSPFYGGYASLGSGPASAAIQDPGHYHSASAGYNGSNGYHNNIQPSIGVYIWKRTA